MGGGGYARPDIELGTAYAYSFRVDRPGTVARGEDGAYRILLTLDKSNTDHKTPVYQTFWISTQRVAEE